MSEEAPPRRKLSLWWVGLMLVGAAVVFAGLLYGVRQLMPYPTYEIPSTSMSPTLGEGDIVAVRGPRALCGRETPEPGDVVVYRSPASSDPFMHRAIAGPGQTAQMKQGRLWIDGRAVPARKVGRALMDPDLDTEGDRIVETLPNGRTYETLDLGSGGQLDDYGPVTIPAGKWLILGDSRDNSMDSRATGLVAKSDICAVGLSVVWSEDSAKIGKRP